MKEAQHANSEEISNLREVWMKSRPVYVEAVKGVEEATQALEKVMGSPDESAYKFVVRALITRDDLVAAESHLVQVKNRLRQQFDEQNGLRR
jgi:hypothetical protein